MLGVFRGYRLCYGITSFSSAIKSLSAFRKSAYTSVALLSLLILAILCPISFRSATPTEAATKSANPATLTFAFTDNKNTASVSLTVTDENGNFATSTDSQKASFSLSTNNATGYTLNLRATGTTTTLSDGTHSINTISSSGITADNFAVNTYGILPSKYNGTANTTNYYPASSTGWKMDETSAANSTANTYTIGLGLKANYATAAGTYTTANTDNGNTGASLVLEYVANAVTYSINYYTNTTDTVTGMPSINPQTGTVAQGTTSTSVTLASAPSRTGYTFVGWCKGTNATTSNVTVKTDGTPDVCNSTSYDASQSFGIDATVSPDTYYLFAMWQRISITVGRQYKLQDSSGNYPSTYTADTNATVLYGDSYTYTIAATSSHQVASQTITNVTATQTISLDVPRVHVTCNTQYRFEDQNGNFSSYTSDTATWAYYGGSCSYSRTETDYRGSSSAANGTAGSASASNVTSTQTLSISFYRNTYTLTVTAGTNTSGASGGGSKRWGQVVQVGVTKTANVTCTAYAAPSWSQGSASGTIGSTSNSGNTYYMNYTMPKSTATVTATSTATSVQQSITLSRSGGASGIVIGGTTYTSSPVSLYCGTYNISGTYDSGYEFSSWGVSGSVSLGSSTTTASNSITVSGAGTLTLTGKSSGYTLTYNMNGGSGSISSQTCVTCTISSTTPSYRKTSYASFKNWNTKADGTGTSYNKSASITLSANTTLYAQWTFTSNTLQATTYSSGCSGTKYDARDGNSYTVAQIVNLCWMTKNFNLPGGTTLYPGDTNVPHGYSTTTTGFTNGNTLPASSTSGFSSNTTAYVYNSGSTTCSSTSSCYSYYSWRAATAGYNSTSISTAVAGDICPKGWRLPTQAELTTLKNTYTTGATLTASPFLGVYAGYYDDSSFTYGGSYGYYWSSTANNSYDAYNLYFNSRSANVYDDSKSSGNSVRCVAKS